MIRYTLTCADGHGFESWFPSSDSYDAQVERGLVSCPVCGTARVAKAPMAPALGRGATPAPVRGPEAAPAPEAVPMVAEPERRMRAMLRALHAHVAANAEHVGPRFPEEARRIHYGEAEHRSIYGQASPAEARALVEEGIDVAPLPPLPDDRH